MPTVPSAAAPLLLTGAHGTLGRAFQRICAIRGLNVVALGRPDLNIANPEAVAETLRRHQPWAVVNAAGYVRVDDAEQDSGRCFLENAVGPAVLAAACSAAQVPLLTFSSDLVFDGHATRPYQELDAPRPLSVYGRSKHQAERDALAAWPNTLIVRTSAFFGPWDEYNFVHFALQAARAGQPFEAISDAVVSPTYVPDLVNVSLDLLLDGEKGVWHLANQGACTWAELARQAVQLAGLSAAGVVARPLSSLRLPAPRPIYSALGSVHGALLPSLESGLQRYLQELATAAEPSTELVMATAS